MVSSDSMFDTCAVIQNWLQSIVKDNNRLIRQLAAIFLSEVHIIEIIKTRD